MEKYKVGYGETEIEVDAIDKTSAIIAAFKIKFPKSLGFGVSVTKVQGEYDPIIVSSKFIIELLELPFYDTEKEPLPKKKTWLQKIFSYV